MPRRTIFWTLAALATLAAALHAWSLRWTCDDAYISFRYAQHFVEGHGLVFNLDPGERPVEGYTNFAWTMWLAVGIALFGGDLALEHWSIVWGVACHAATVLLLASIAWRASSGRAVVPIAACGYAAIHHAASLAPAGLETAMFTLLVTGMLRYSLALRCGREAWLLGFLGVLAAMTRPDGALPVAMAGLFVAYDAWKRGAPRLLVGYVLPFLLVFVPYLLWRHSYYGYWLPNTFYAKSGTGSYAPQGLRYVVPFVTCYWPLLLAVVPCAWFVLRRPDPLAAISAFLGRRPWLAIGAYVGSYVAFVLYVGGDFMFARFLIPVLPAVLLAFDVACQRWRPLWLQWGMAALLVIGFTFRVEPNGLGNAENDVSDNRTISVRDYVPGMSWADAFRLVGGYLQTLFQGLDVHLAIAGGHANLAYRARAPVAIEVAAGLTDAYIARIPVPPGGKRGHDRPYTLYPEYLVRRRVHFMCDLSFGAIDPWREILFTPVNLPLKLVTWDRELMRELKRREPSLQFQDFEAVLDSYIAELPSKSKEQVAADYVKFTAFYFAHNDDAARKAAFESFLK